MLRQRKRIDRLNARIMDLYEQGKYRQALAIAQQALELSQGCLHDDEAVDRWLRLMAGALSWSMGDYARAEALLKEALAV
jgi:tetratricopeptide (TPR) repeat protein